jgi:fatty acid desaturase
VKTEKYYIARLLAFLVGATAAIGAVLALGFWYGLDALGYGAALIAGRELMRWANSQ